MRNLFVFFFLVLILIAPFHLTAAEVEVDKKDELSTCDTGQEIRFALGKPHIQFQIPENYLNDPDNFYHKTKDPAGLIRVAFRKNDMAPHCHKRFANNKESNEFYKITIKPHSSGLVPKDITSRLRWYPISKGIEAEKFKVFTKRYPEDKPWEREDILIPIDQDDAKILFLQCSYSFASVTPTVRTGCRVISDFNNGIRINYGLEPDEAQHYQQIDKRIKAKLSEFLVN